MRCRRVDNRYNEDNVSIIIRRTGENDTHPTKDKINGIPSGKIQID